MPLNYQQLNLRGADPTLPYSFIEFGYGNFNTEYGLPGTAEYGASGWNSPLGSIDGGCGGDPYLYPMVPGNIAYNSPWIIADDGQPTPEPATIALLGSALLGLGVVYLRRRRAKA
jgi:hypothetical protein